MIPFSFSLIRHLARGSLLSLVTLAGLVQGANPDLLYVAQPEFSSGPIASFQNVLTDVNHDGKADLIRSVNVNAVGVQLGLGNGLFGPTVAYPTGNLGGPLKVSDLNHDGHPDILIANVNDSTLSVLLGKGDGTFQPQIVTDLGLHATSIAVTDFNLDGNPDLIVTGYPTGPVEGYVETLTGNGNGSFNTAVRMQVTPRTVGAGTRDVAVADLNGDGWPDFVTSSPGAGGPITTFLNNRDGTFKSPDLETLLFANLGKLVLGDFNRDGKIDLAVIWGNDSFYGNTNAGRNIGVLMGNGDGTFGQLKYDLNGFYTTNTAVYGVPTGASTFIASSVNLVAADMDGDGILDLVTFGQNIDDRTDYIAILRGKGNGEFTYGSSTPAVASWLSVADLNNDGSLDIVATPNSGPVFPFLSGVIAPGFTTPDATRFTSSASNSFTVKGIGNPAPIFSQTGTLPAGVSFTSGGVLSGVPAAGTEGVYPLTIKASNSVGQSVTQSFTLTVSPPGLLVTTAADEDDGTNDPLKGTGTSLREAVNFANTLTGPQTITFAPALAGATINLTQTGVTFSGACALEVKGSLTIQGLTSGHGLTLQRGAAGTLRLFVVNANASLSLNDLTLANGTGDSGGAIMNAGTLRANRCLFRNNQATLGGGAIYSGSSNAQTLILSNCTLTGNQGAFIGGAIYSTSSSTSTLTHLTIVGNLLTSSGSSGGALDGGSSTILASSIVMKNTKSGKSGYFNIGATLNSASHHNMIGYSLTSSPYDGGLVNGTNGNITGVSDDYIVELADHGGPTLTFAPSRDSPSINAGAAADGSSTDQRGYPVGLRSGGLLGRFYRLPSAAATALLSPISNLDALVPGAVAVSPRIDFGAGTEADPGDGSVLDRGGSGGNPFGNAGVDVGVDNLAAQWTGFIAAPQTADYRFTLRSDDGSVLYVDDVLVVNNNNLQPMSNVSGTIHLGAGRHTIRVGYIEATGDSGVQLSWEQLTGGNPFPRRIVSPDVLSTGTVPDIGAYEDVVGDDDPDHDGLSNAKEYAFNTNPFVADTDNDGFNDATEMLADSKPYDPNSVPPATHIERVLGYGPGRGLDLSGNFRYAFSANSSAVSGQVGDANFTTATAPGISINAATEIDLWTSRSFGTNAADQALAGVFGSVRLADSSSSDPAARTVKVALANLVAGRNYKLQLLFADAPGHDRIFDVSVNGSTVVSGFNTNTAQGSASAGYAASAVVHSFTSPGTDLQIELSGANAPANVDANPILNGVTLEEIPTNAAAPVFGTASGVYDIGTTVSISAPTASANAGATIRYTTDGSAPSETVGTVYNGPISLVSNVTIRAIAVGGGWLSSPETSATYTILAPLAGWRNLQGLPADGSQDLSMPAGDGVTNLLKYAFNMAPTAGSLAVRNSAVLPVGGSAGLPRIGQDAQGRLSLEFVRRKASTNPGISYTVETGTNPGDLRSLDLTGATVTSIDSIWERVTVVDPVLTSARFGRLKVIALP